MRGSRFIAMLAIGALTIAACGGDDDDSDASPSGSPSGIEEADDDDDDVDGSVDPDDIADAIGGFTSDECRDAIAAIAAAATAVPLSLSGQDTDLDTSLDKLEAFTDEAPEEIRDDLRTIYEGYARVVEALGDSGFDPQSGEIPDADALAQLEALGEELDDEEFQEAGERVSQWLEEECAPE